MLFYTMGAIVSVFCLGIGIFSIKNARKLGESLYRKSDATFNLKFWVWSYRVVGILAFWMIIYMLYQMFFT
jgi:hypothetical protein